MTAYQQGFHFGIDLARKVLETGERDVRRVDMGYMPDKVPMTRNERIRWLNGLSAGIKHVAFNEVFVEGESP